MSANIILTVTVTLFCVAGYILGAYARFSVFYMMFIFIGVAACFYVFYRFIARNCCNNSDCIDDVGPFFDLNNIAFYKTDCAGRLIYKNEKFRQFEFDFYASDLPNDIELLLIFLKGGIIDVDFINSIYKSGNESSFSISVCDKEGNSYKLLHHIRALNCNGKTFSGLSGTVTVENINSVELLCDAKLFSEYMKIAEEIVYVHDLEGNFLKVNDAITKYTGFSSAELGIGTNLSNYLAPQVFDNVLQEIDDLVCTGGFRILEVPVVVSSGERILFKVGAVLLRDSENAPMAVLGFAKPLEKAEEEHRTFDPDILDSLSHELRTPLAGIFGSLKVLEDQLLPDDAKDCVEKCTISAKRLKTAVNDFLVSVTKDSGKGHPADLVSGLEGVEEIVAEDTSGLEILLAEDDMSSQVIMRKLLESWGHSVRTAANGVDVLSHLGEQEYDLVLMDIQMPEMDGHETIRVIRSGKFGGEMIPIVAMSAYSSESELEKIKALNVSEFISKPIRPEALKSVLDRLFPAGN